MIYIITATFRVSCGTNIAITQLDQKRRYTQSDLEATNYEQTLLIFQPMKLEKMFKKQNSRENRMKFKYKTSLLKGRWIMVLLMLYVCDILLTNYFFRFRFPETQKLTKYERTLLIFQPMKPKN